jgi:hypothetical protein
MIDNYFPSKRITFAQQLELVASHLLLFTMLPTSLPFNKRWWWLESFHY